MSKWGVGIVVGLGLFGFAAFLSNGGINAIMYEPQMTVSLEPEPDVAETDNSQNIHVTYYSKDEMEEKCEKLNYKKVMRNADDNVGNFYVAEFAYDPFNNDANEAYTAYYDDDIGEWIENMVEDPIIMTDTRSDDSDGYFKLMPGDIIKGYGQFTDVAESDNGTQYMMFDLYYADLIKE